MSFRHRVTLAGLCVGLASLLMSAHADTVTGYLYVSDYGAQQLDRFSYSFDTVSHAISNWQPAGQTSGSAVFITDSGGGGVKEGLQGTANDIIVVATGGYSLDRYRLDGTYYGTINITDSGGSPHTLSSVGNVAITKDGRYMYAPESGAGVIDKIDMATGKIVANISFAGAHDVLILPDGSLLAGAWTGADTGSQGIWHITSDLSSKTQVIAAGDNGLGNPTGLSLSGNNLYIQSITGPGPTSASTVFKYTLDPTTYAATFAAKTTSSLLQFDFGTDIGPDGNLYISGLGGGQSHADFGAPNGYTNGVYEFNTSNSTVSLTEGGYVVGTGAASDGFYSPKYLQFGYNFISADDPGGPTPEPGSVALFGGLIASSAAVMLKRRRRSA